MEKGGMKRREKWVGICWLGFNWFGIYCRLTQKQMSSRTHPPSFIDEHGWESPETPPLRPRALPHYILNPPTPALHQPLHSLKIKPPLRDRSTPFPLDLPLLNAHNGTVVVGRTIDWSSLPENKRKWGKNNKYLQVQMKLNHSQLNSRLSQMKPLEKSEESSRRLNVRLGQPDMQAVAQRSLSIYLQEREAVRLKEVRRIFDLPLSM